MASDKKPLLDLTDESKDENNDQVLRGNVPRAASLISRNNYGTMDELSGANHPQGSPKPEDTFLKSVPISDRPSLLKSFSTAASKETSSKDSDIPYLSINRQADETGSHTAQNSDSSNSDFDSKADGSDFSNQGIRISPNLIGTQKEAEVFSNQNYSAEAAVLPPSSSSSSSERFAQKLKSHIIRPRPGYTNIPETGENTSVQSIDPIMEHNGNFKSNKKPSTPADKDEKTPFFVYYLACFATIGGLLFGYDTGIVSGAMLLIKEFFNLSTIWTELIVSATVGAAAVFSLCAGFMCDFFGRKFTIMAASLVFVAGAVVMGASQSKEMLMVGRIIVGIAIGFASMAVPVYIAEAAPPGIRGKLVTMNQLFITIGILISSVIAGAFSSMKKTGWRYMLGLAGVPGAIQFVGFLFLPESPRWLIMKGKEEEAKRVLQRIRNKEDVSEEMAEINEVIEEDKKNEGIVLGRVFQTPHVRKALFVGCGLQLFQQLCGVNTVIYYSATILKMSGFPPESAIWLVLVPNGINFLSTIVGVVLVEKLGRKKMLLGSFVGVMIALIVLAVGFQLSANFSPSMHNITDIFDNDIYNDTCLSRKVSNCERCIEDDDCGFCYMGSGQNGTCLKTANTTEDEDIYSTFGRCNKTNKDLYKVKFSHGFCPTDYSWMAVLGLALFVLAFAPGLGPMPWTINSEIYPMWARSTGTSLATGCNWVFNLIVSLFFLTLTEAITKYGAFWLFAAICVVGLLFTIAFVPETKNKSLEEVEELFKGKKKGGADNLGYEREIPPPKDPTSKDVTRL